MRNELLYTVGGGAPEGQIHFIASDNFSNVNFFRDITNANPSYDFSNLKVYINGKLTEQSANAISASADDDVIIKATSGKYPLFSAMDFIKAIEEPFPLMHRASGKPITGLGYCFSGCSSLTSIPPGLFDNNPQVTDFSQCFRNCYNLAVIPPGLFDNNTRATDFSYCFFNCYALDVIPPGLFDNNNRATNFSGCFSGCRSLTSIPTGLFDNNTRATDFSHCFYQCNSLTSIPQGLFDKNTQVTDFRYCFMDCPSLTVNVQIGSTASSVFVSYFARRTKAKGTVYCRAGSAAYNEFAVSLDADVNVLTY